MNNDLISKYNICTSLYIMKEKNIEIISLVMFKLKKKIFFYK